MSVVKKLQNGGAVYNDYEQFIADKLNNEKFTAKSLPIARKAASKFVNLAKSGKLGEAYAYDPISDKYSVNADVLPDDLKSLE
jgi:hypothetical protein